MPSRRALLAAIGAASVPLAGCGDAFGGVLSREVPADWTPEPGEWGGPGYDQANSRYNPHATPPRTEPSVAWEVDASRPRMAVADGTTFLRESETLRGIDDEDGSEQFAVSRPSSARFRYVDGRLYDLTEDGLDALTLEGEPAWDDPISYVDRIGSFVEREGYVYASTGINSLHHHDADTGERVDVTVHDVDVRGLANRDGVLYAALENGVVAYDVDDDGRLDELWRHRVGAESELEPIVVGVGGSRAHLVQQRPDSGDERALVVFDVDAEEVLGTIELDDMLPHPVFGPHSYVATIQADGSRPSGGEIHAFEGTEEVWSVELEAAPGQLVLAADTLYVGGLNERFLAAIDAESGDALWEYEGAFPQAVAGETVYATTEDDRLVALREE